MVNLFGMTENETARVQKLRAKIVDLTAKVKAERADKAAIKASAKEALAAAKSKTAKPAAKAKPRKASRSQPSATA